MFEKDFYREKREHLATTDSIVGLNHLNEMAELSKYLRTEFTK